MTYAEEMSEFDIKAAEWDKNMMHRERAETIADTIISQIPLNRKMKALEFGAGTGLLSFKLKDHLGHITLIDNSEGMVKILLEKAEHYGAKTTMKVLKTDLEKEEYPGEKVDLIYTLMVLHHVNDVNRILGKFGAMLISGGYLAIADLYREDGSFHGDGFTGHKGFDPEELTALLEKHGFSDIEHRTVYVIDKFVEENSRKKFGVFLMTAVRKEKEK